MRWSAVLGMSVGWCALDYAEGNCLRKLAERGVGLGFAYCGKDRTLKVAGYGTRLVAHTCDRVTHAVAGVMIDGWSRQQSWPTAFMAWQGLSKNCGVRLKRQGWELFGAWHVLIYRVLRRGQRCEGLCPSTRMG